VLTSCIPGAYSSRRRFDGFSPYFGAIVGLAGLTLGAFLAQLRQLPGDWMKRFAQAGSFALLLACTAMHAGCSSGAGGLTTSATGALPADAASGITNEDPMARPVAVAWTSARAKRCGFYFDPARLKTNYLAYEAKQGTTGEQYAKVEKTYDATYKATSEKVSAETDYCTERKGLEIKADLERHLAGDYTPNLPKPKNLASCGFWGCQSSQDEPFNTKKFWSDAEKNAVRK
jgi:hypothetical protein